jgi:predicted nucleotidyltransferase
MDMQHDWLLGLRSWANQNDSVHKLWLFGSRAKGTSNPESDVDIAITLMPTNGKHDWAAGNYVAFHSEWKRELETIVGRHVSLEAIEPGSIEDATVVRTLLWERRPGEQPGKSRAVLVNAHPLSEDPDVEREIFADATRA